MGGGMSPCLNADNWDKAPHIPVKIKISNELLKQIQIKTKLKDGKPFVGVICNLEVGKDK